MTFGMSKAQANQLTAAVQQQSAQFGALQANIAGGGNMDFASTLARADGILGMGGFSGGNGIVGSALALCSPNFASSGIGPATHINQMAGVVQNNNMQALQYQQQMMYQQQMAAMYGGGYGMMQPAMMGGGMGMNPMAAAQNPAGALMGSSPLLAAAGQLSAGTNNQFMQTLGSYNNAVTKQNNVMMAAAMQSQQQIMQAAKKQQLARLQAALEEEEQRQQEQNTMLMMVLLLPKLLKKLG